MNHRGTKTRGYGLDEGTETIATAIVQAAFAVHTTLGPGLLESVYEVCLAHELHECGIPFVRQLSLPVVYRSLRLDGGLRLDLVVAGSVVVELKAVETLLPVHCLGLLINFNIPLIKDGIKRVVL